MHELSIATSLVESLLEIAKKQSSNKVVAVQLRVGKLRLISLDQLKFSYKILSKGTILEGSRLSIEETPGIARCPNCGYAREFKTANMEFHFAPPALICPRCTTTLSIEGGEECLITKVRMAAPSRLMKTSPAS